MDMSGRLSVMERNYREAVRLLLQAGHRHFVFKMTDVSYIDSCGLGQLVSVYTSIKNLGGSMRIVAPGRRVRELLKISKLDTVFEILEDERRNTNTEMLFV
jgi:anti-sigma B factor antagonist